MGRELNESHDFKPDIEYDFDKIDEMVLALLHLTKHDLTKVGDSEVMRAWKGQDWDTMNRVYEKGYISDPKSKAKSVQLTEEGTKRSAELFERHFKKAAQVVVGNASDMTKDRT